MTSPAAVRAELLHGLADTPGRPLPLPLLPGTGPHGAAARIAGLLGGVFAGGFVLRERERGRVLVGLGTTPAAGDTSCRLAFLPFDPDDPRDAGPWRAPRHVPAPRWLLAADGNGLTVAWCPGPGERSPDPGELEAILAPPPVPSLPVPPTPGLPGEKEIAARVSEAISALRGEGLAKLVPSVPARVELPRAVPPGALAARIAGERGNDRRVRFAVLGGDCLLAGATPERLFRVEPGGELATEALAGTAPAGRERDLLASAKDLAEHALVVARIREALAPLVTELAFPARPGPVRIPGLVHLHTPFRGRLRPGVGPGELLAALHPTPAVAGEPPGAARAWLRRHEEPRGIFAGPLVARAGGAVEALVVLRTAVIEGTTVHLRAGAGIVPGSDPAREAAEIRAKLAATLEGLGLGGPREGTR